MLSFTLITIYFAQKDENLDVEKLYRNIYLV